MSGHSPVNMVVFSHHSDSKTQGHQADLKGGHYRLQQLR
jgi:hypothetical protein